MGLRPTLGGASLSPLLAAPCFPSRGRPRGVGEGGAPGWALGPICPRVCPLLLSLAPWALVGGAPAHLVLVPFHSRLMQASGAGGPSRWTPGTLRWSWYITGDARNTSGGQNLTSYILFFTFGPFRNSSRRSGLIRDSEQHSVTMYKLSL